MSLKPIHKARGRVLMSLQPLMLRARREGLVFWLRVQNRMFTPAELEDQLANGRFMWGPRNWELKNPTTRETVWSGKHGLKP